MNTDIHRLLDEAFAGRRDDARRAGPEGGGARQPRRPRRRARGVRTRARRMPRARRSPSSATCASCSDEPDGCRRPPRRPESLRRDAAAPPRAAEDRASSCASVVWSLVLVVAHRRSRSSARPACCRCRSASIIALLGLRRRPAVGLLVGDSLSQETTTNHPMPHRTARGGYALATLPRRVRPRASAGWSPLGALPMWGDRLRGARRDRLDHPVRLPRAPRRPTATRRGCVRRIADDSPPNRFEEEPETAARFGIYTAVIWHRHLRRHRRARLHGRLVVGAARLRRRVRRDDAPSRPHAVRPRKQVLSPRPRARARTHSHTHP